MSSKKQLFYYDPKKIKGELIKTLLLSLLFVGIIIALSLFDIFKYLKFL